jgi:hypothetical protein
MSLVDWWEWHKEYSVADSYPSLRREAVSYHTARALCIAPAGPIRVMSVCAGQGLDIISGFVGDAHTANVDCVFLEYDPRNALEAASNLSVVGLRSYEVRVCDAGLCDSYAGSGRANIMYLVGLISHLSDAEISSLIAAIPNLCSQGAQVIWTVPKSNPEVVHMATSKLMEAKFDQVLRTDIGSVGMVVTSQFMGVPQSRLEAGSRIFTFGSRD